MCAICGGASEDRALAVDHEHRSGSIRGLLCSPCNSGLGMFRDDPQMLHKAIAYLEAHVRGADPEIPTLSAADREQLMVGFDLVTDSFATDVEQLASGGDITDTLMWTFLPDVSRERYDLRFAIQFLLAVGRVRERLGAGWSYPARSVGEELALHAAIRTAIADATEHGPDGSSEHLEALSEHMLPDLDVLLLFERRLHMSREDAVLLGASHLWFEDWFRPFDVAAAGERAALN